MSSTNVKLNLKSKLDTSHDDYEPSWDGAIRYAQRQIRDAKARIRQLEHVIEDFRKFKRQGLPYGTGPSLSDASGKEASAARAT